MFQINSGKFADYRDHHSGWFKIYRFHNGFEIWFGNCWIWVDW